MSINETIPFNFDENYKFIEQKFKDKGYDIEEGSNSMQLVTAMSYLTSMLNANTAVNINETLLPLARKRNMVLRDARVLGYEIDHIRSYRYNITLKFVNETSSPINKVIERYTEFTSGDLTYYYMGEELAFTIPPNDEITKTIIVTEGELLKYTDPGQQALTVVTSSTQNEDGEIEVVSYIDIPHTNVEEDGIEAYLTYYDEYGVLYNREPWTKSETFLIDKDTRLSREFVRLDNIDYQTPRIYFKIGDVGRDIRAGTIIEMNVLKSSGADGKMMAPPTTDLDAEIISYSINSVGSDEETIESIKANAPLFYNTANRLITKPDFESFCNRLSKIRDSKVWDGHDEKPKVPGHIWFSFLSSNIERSIISLNDMNTEYRMQNLDDVDNWYLEQRVPGTPDPDIVEVFDQLKNYSVPTLIFHHRNPVYINFDYDIQIVKYRLSSTRAELNDSVFKVIDSYFTGFDENNKKVIQTPAESYNYEYFQSSLNKRIDNELTDITGFNIDLNATACICKNSIINEFDNFEKIVVHLGYPYEDIIDDDQNIIVNNLPSIDTNDFIGTKNIYVNFNSATIDEDKTSYDIMYGTGNADTPNGNDSKVGEYIVHTDIIKTIEVVFFIKSNGGYTTGLTESDFNENREITVKYKTPNFRLVRNSIPRLRTVRFI